jgi:hypothetical protein
VTLHDVFTKMQPCDCRRLQSLARSSTATEVKVVYSCPKDTLDNWEAVWNMNTCGCDCIPSKGVETDGATSAHHSQYLSRRIVQALGRDAAIDADLIIVFGPVLCLSGFPPWQTRFCEIEHLGILDAATSTAMHGALSRYKQVFQRFGK